MNDTRALLNRIADFRKRLDAMPRLLPAKAAPSQPADPPIEPDIHTKSAEPASRTHAILEHSLRQLAGTASTAPPALTNRARRLLIDAQALVTRLKSLVDEPLLAGPRAGTERSDESADPLVVHFRETVALTEAAVRYALTLPEPAEEQRRLCEGLEGMIDAARRRFELLAGTLERRRIDEDRIDILARFLVSLDIGEGTLDAEPIVRLADRLLAEEPGRPLRFISADPLQTQAYLGGPEYPPVARFVAAHSLNCGCVLARIAHHDPDLLESERELVIAGLLHDVGMLRIDPKVLANAGPLNDDHKQLLKTHAHNGAQRIMARLPHLRGLSEAAACHHERGDRSGYPAGTPHLNFSPLTRLVAAVDVYAAMCAPRPHRPAFDPRAALTDVQVMAERGLLDSAATAKLLSLGLYPNGTVVELADGATALVVTTRDPRGAYNSSKPAVAVLADRDGRPMAVPRFLDLSDISTGNVVRALDAEDRWNRLGRSYPEWV